ncbi:UNVERIFIED_CONTAM: hypothetical protein PYX00_009529 [Menopon gallinae]|uniref:Uncharacterized protein n=1 Tax=Menopon gallinae TaxID=328185 RepID=A0AAW2HBM3_9NEOP
MKVLFFVLTSAYLGLAVTEDSVAMESQANYQPAQQIYPEERKLDEETYQRHPIKYYRPRRGEKKRNLVHREREARGEEWKAYSEGDVKGPVYELPPGYELEGKVFENPKGRYYQIEEQPQIEYQSHQPKKEDENLKVESSQHPGSYLSHIKEQMNEGKLLGYSSFVEHFSENDDAEELKTAMREGSLEDIKKLVPKSSVSFQLYHGQEEHRTVKAEPTGEKKDFSWNQLNDWHQPIHPTPTQWTQPQVHHVRPHKTYILSEHKKRTRKHPEGFRVRHHFHSEETPEVIVTTAAPEPEHKLTSNELFERGEENYPQIIPSVSYEIGSESQKEYEVVQSAEQDRQESHNSYTFDSENGSWRPTGKKATQTQTASEIHKTINTPKPPESSKLYYEYLKNSKPVAFEETSKFSQLPKVGRVVTEQPLIHVTKYIKATPETHHHPKKPLRIKSTPQPSFKRPTTPTFASGEDFNQHYAQIPTATPLSTILVTPQPTKHWSEPDTTRNAYQSELRPNIPVKVEKILKQTEQLERPGGKGNGNIFLTKEFQNEVSEFFKGGKTDLEWVPATQFRYDSAGSSPVAYKTSPTEGAKPKPKKYRIYRSERNLGNPKNVVILGPENQNSPPGEFSVSASYKIDRNRKSDDQAQ